MIGRANALQADARGSLAHQESSALQIKRPAANAGSGQNAKPAEARQEEGMERRFDADDEGAVDLTARDQHRRPAKRLKPAAARGGERRARPLMCSAAASP